MVCKSGKKRLPKIAGPNVTWLVIRNTEWNNRYNKPYKRQTDLKFVSDNYSKSNILLCFDVALNLSNKSHQFYPLLLRQRLLWLLCFFALNLQTFIQNFQVGSNHIMVNTKGHLANRKWSKVASPPPLLGRERTFKSRASKRCG